MAKTNILVLVKTSSEDEGERRLHQDEFLLGSNTVIIFLSYHRLLQKKYFRIEKSFV